MWQLLLVLTALAPQAPDVPPPAVAVVDEALYLLDVADGTGSGFLYRDGVTVVTNRHVIEPLAVGDSLKLRPIARRDDGFTDLGEPLGGKVRYKHPDLDVAVIELMQPSAGRPLVAEPTARQRFLPRGTRLLVHGFPSTLSPTLSVGVVSGHYRDLIDGATYYLTDAAMGAGSSGGPVTTWNGALIGMATAVYDVPDEIGFEWGFVIPVGQIDEIFGSAGGAGDLPPPLSLPALVEAVETAADTPARLRALRDGAGRIIADSGTIRELTARLGDYLRDAEPLLATTTPTELRALTAAMLDVDKDLLARGITLAFREESPEELTFAQVVRVNDALDASAERILTRSLNGLEPWRASAMLASMLDVQSQRCDQSIGEAENACTVLAPIDFNNDLRLREIDHEVLVRTLADLFMAGGLLDRIEQTLETYGDRAQGSAALRERIRSIRDATADDRRRWDALPPSCQSLYAMILDGRAIAEVELDGEYAGWATADDIRTLHLEATNRGYVFSEARVVSLDPQGEAVVPFTLDADGAVVAAVSNTVVDIDLELRDQDGDTIAEDYERDHMPVTVLRDAARGRYDAVVQNATGEPCRVVVLIFVEP